MRPLLLTPDRSCCALHSFLSLHQKDANGERTPAEAALFGRSLSWLSEWYAHPSTLVLKVTALPEGYPAGFTFGAGTTPNQAQYYDRGWCFCESSLSNLVKIYDAVLDLALLPIDDQELLEESGIEEGQDPYGVLLMMLGHRCAKGRAPPLAPDDFCLQLEEKSFTSKKADLETVSGVYREGFESQMKVATDLCYPRLNWGDAEVAMVAAVIGGGHVPMLSSLSLDNNMIGDAGVISLAAAIGGGSVPHLAIWELDQNQIGDEGAIAVAKVVGSGAVNQLVRLELGDNQIGDAGAAELAKALGANGGLRSLRVLGFENNPTSESGEEELDRVLAEIYLLRRDSRSRPYISAIET